MSEASSQRPEWIRVKRPGRSAPTKPDDATPVVAAQDRRGLPLVAIAFMLVLLIPITFSLGPVRLSPYRTVLLLAFLPLFFAWISGRAGGVRAHDVMLLAAFLWGGLTFIVNHGFGEGIQPAGILVIEAFGAYLLGRICVRGIVAMNGAARLHALMVLALLPLALLETQTGDPLIIEIVRSLGMTTFNDGNQNPRLGLERAQVVFEHPLLYGVFVASMVGWGVYGVAYGRSLAGKAAIVGLGLVSTIASVSTGPLTMVVTQFGLIAWDQATRGIGGRWRILGLLVIAAYVTVDLISTRTPFHVFVHYLTMSSGSAYTRIQIFQFGIQEVWRHPIFGIGFNDWERPSYLSSSVDNFWLLIAMRHGLITFLLFAGAIMLIMLRAGRRAFDDPRAAAMRAGWLISLGGVIVGAGTVHLWNATFCWLLFLIGCGTWLADPAPASRRASSIEKEP